MAKPRNQPYHIMYISQLVLTLLILIWQTHYHHWPTQPWLSTPWFTKLGPLCIFTI